jgi:hypothetical protein
MAQTTVKSEQIATNAISGTIIADNAITGVHIAQNAILTQHIDDGQVNTDQLAADAVTGAKLADSSVVTANIQDDQVTSDKLANNITIAGTLASTGVLTANAGVVVDNITIDGTEIDLSSGDLTLDVAGDIILDADGGDFFFKDGGTEHGYISTGGNILGLTSSVSDDDIVFTVNDGGTATTALTIDGSDAGTAIFNHDVKLPDSGEIVLGAGSDLKLYHDGSNSYIANEYGVLYIDQRVQDGNFIFRNDDGSGGNAEYIVLDGGGEEIKMKKKTWFEGSTDLYVDLFADSGTSQGTGSFRFYTDGGSAKESVAGIVMQQEDGTSRKGEMLFQVADNGNPATALKIFNNKDVQVDGRIASYYSGSSHVAIRGLNGGQYIQYSSSLDLKFMRIDTYPNSGANHTMSLSGSKVKIGSDSPPLAGILSVVGGNAGVPALFVQNTNVDSVGLRAQVANNNAGNYIIAAYNSDGAKWNIRNDGDHQGTDTSIGSLSDSRLKKDVSDLTYDINKFKQYRPIEFNWINPELHKSVSGKSRGFLAQEVKALDDYYVDKYEAEGDDIPLVDEDKMAHSTKFGYKDAMYISVIKQLITRLETAEAKIAVLEG